MTGHKRKASQQLTSNSPAISEPVNELPPAICDVFTLASGAAIWAVNMLTSWLMRPATTTMTYGSADGRRESLLGIEAATHMDIVAPDPLIQVSPTRDDGALAIKRQRKHHTASRIRRSKSTVDEHRKAGQGKLDLAGCASESEARARLDEFWKPPELGLLKTKPPRLQGQRLPNQDAEGRRNEDGLLQRRQSGPASFPQTQESKPLHADHIASPENTSTVTRIYGPSPQDTPKNLASVDKRTLEQQLESLLVLGDRDQDAHRALLPSDYAIKLRNKRAEERAAEQKVAAALKAKELRLSRRKPLKALVRPLSLEWERAVQDAEFLNNDYNRVITTSIGGTELHLKDFKTLLGHRQWLNDEIINSYIEWIVDAANKAAARMADVAGEPLSKVPKYIGHNSFFFENLLRKGPSSTQGLMRRKKASGVSLMEVDSVLVPICSGAHWTIGVVRPVAKTIEYFDSMGGSPQAFVQYMREWLKFQLGNAYIEEEWKVPRTPCARQNNGYDCGVFVCTNAFCVVFGLETSCYMEQEMELQRRNIAAVLINRGFTGDFGWETSGL